jgi:hypothetical protein
MRQMLEASAQAAGEADAAMRGLHAAEGTPERAAWDAWLEKTRQRMNGGGGDGKVT